jgi:poly(3-hydroxybutyrate) depolymerase
MTSRYGSGEKERMSALQLNSPLAPAMPRPRLYAGADQPARLSLEIDSIEDHAELVPVAVQDVVQAPFCALTRLARSDRTDLPRVLVVAPLSCHFPVLLRDLVLGLLPSCQVFITDWVNARHVPDDRGRFDLQENISYVVEAMRVIGPDLHVIALCQGAVPALVATAYHAESNAACAPRSLVLIAAPVDPAAKPTRVSRLLKARPLSWYEHNIIGEVPAPNAGRGRLVYPGSVQLWGLLAYLARHVSEGGELLGKLLADDGADPVRFPFLDLYSAVMDLPAEVFLGIVRHVYQERTLVEGKLRVRNEAPSLRAIRATALMTVEGEYDDIAAPGQTGCAHDLCPSVPTDARRRRIVPGCGHFSLFHGRIWRTQVLPEVRAFIERYDRAGLGLGA